MSKLVLELPNMGLCTDPPKERTPDIHVFLLEPESAFISSLWLLNWLL